MTSLRGTKQSVDLHFYKEPSFFTSKYFVIFHIMAWSKEEVKLIVDDYFKMLMLELDHHAYNKTTHRNTIFPLLNSRSKGSVEFKHQNISAVMIQMGLPYIKGYKPMVKFQQLLAKEVTEYVVNNKSNLESYFEKFWQEIVDLKPIDQINFNDFLNNDLIESVVKEDQPIYKPIKINYLEKEQNNRNLGEKGEKLIIDYEKWRLIKAGKEALADKIEWISKEQGDGTGFDILSKNTNGTDRIIEVKTTKLPKETPIFLTRTEYQFAASKEKDFFLYRVFNFDSTPQFFQRNGSYDRFSILKPQTYKAYIF